MKLQNKFGNTNIDINFLCTKTWISTILFMPKRNVLFFGMVLSFLLGAATLSAQTRAGVSLRKAQEEPETIPFKSRWAFRTNAFDWLLTVPNVAVEFDVSNSVYNKSTIEAGFRGNWNTWQKYKSPVLFNILDGHIGYRYYWRTEMRTLQAGEKLTWTDRLFSRKRLNPRFWRAYYVGGYVNANKYTVKLGKKGVQGNGYGIGISGGFGIPLYTYDHGAVDFEFGASVGVALNRYDVFRYDRSDNCYPRIEDECKGMHVTPFPVVHDVRVAFVYRFTSIKEKYGKTDYKKLEARTARKNQKMARRDSIQKIRDLRALKKDSVEQAKKALRLQEREQRQLQDSLKQIEEASRLQLNQLNDSAGQTKETPRSTEKRKRRRGNAGEKVHAEEMNTPEASQPSGQAKEEPQSETSALPQENRVPEITPATSKDDAHRPKKKKRQKQHNEATETAKERNNSENVPSEEDVEPEKQEMPVKKKSKAERKREKEQKELERMMNNMGEGVLNSSNSGLFENKEGGSHE